jgi:hypothetical protein
MNMDYDRYVVRRFEDLTRLDLYFFAARNQQSSGTSIGTQQLQPGKVSSRGVQRMESGLDTSTNLSNIHQLNQAHESNTLSTFLLHLNNQALFIAKVRGSNQVKKESSLGASKFKDKPIKKNNLG